MVSSCYLRQLCHIKSVEGDVYSHVFPGKRLGLLSSRLWSDTLLSMYIILVHLPMFDEQRTLPDPGALNKEPLFHIDSSWVTLAEISGSPIFAECALPITLGFLTRHPMDTWEAASPG